MAEPDEAPTNAPEITVSELAGAIKRAIEDRFGYVRVRGEISGYRGPHSSGHAYFSLKDANARLDAVIWKGVFARMRVRPEEGLEVVAIGKLTTFPGKSSYQIVIEALEPAGIGALMALLEARRRKLAEEGLFDAARKRPLPYLPKVIGVVTSPTGAVIRDILHRLADRFPLHVIVWPVRVQGETSAAEVATAIDGFNALGGDGAIPRPDVLIVARGGGSLEDLWSFNEEIVVRAAARSQIPLVAAVGHETDWTLIDHVADMRAPTPTAAAELSVPVRSELLATLADLDGRGRGAILRLAQRRRADLRALERALPAGDSIARRTLYAAGARPGSTRARSSSPRSRAGCSASPRTPVRPACASAPMASPPDSRASARR
jgi:exodeoxyribonuclease VII large subunit